VAVGFPDALGASREALFGLVKIEPGLLMLAQVLAEVIKLHSSYQDRGAEDVC
jgi:hypothetical protein